jgi:predicted transcriptional regulator of viral defense system
MSYISDNRNTVMTTHLAENIIEHMKEKAEGTIFGAKEFLHLGARAAIDQALSRLAKKGMLLRAGRGAYVLPVGTRFGSRPPSVENLVKAISVAKGETIATHGATAANALGLTTQVPVRSIYLTSGRSRRFKLGAHIVEFKHAPNWQLTLADRPAGQVVRALAWLGPQETEKALKTLKRKLPSSALNEVAAVRSRLPSWMAEQISKVVYHG